MVRILLALFCFLFVAILYASFGCNECNPYKAKAKPDTIIYYSNPCVLPEHPDSVVWVIEERIINP